MEVDNQGDLVLQRRSRQDEEDGNDVIGCLSDLTFLSDVHLLDKFESGEPHNTVFHVDDKEIWVAHHGPTGLQRVGLQVWHGSLVLADFLISLSSQWTQPLTLVELGAGTGFTSIALAAVAPVQRAFVTDGDLEVLRNCQLNWEGSRAGCPGGPDALRVRRLDWLHPPDWLREGGGACAAGPGPASQFMWTPEDTAQLDDLAYVVAADCVYEDHLTDAMMRSAAALLRRSQRPRPALLVALERRVCFSLDDLDVRAPAYEHWRSLFAAADDAPGPGALAEGSPCGGPGGEGSLPLRGRRIELAAVPCHVRGYSRSDLLELWELTLPEADVP